MKTLNELITEDQARSYLLRNPLITSLIDTDFYKFTMQQVVYHFFKNKETKFEFKNRNDIPLARYQELVDAQLDLLCQLTFKAEELKYLASIEINNEKVFKGDYINALKDFKLNRNNIKTRKDEDGITLHVDIEKDSWFNNILFEVYTLSIINGIHSVMEACRNGGVQNFIDCGLSRLQDKIDYVKKQPTHLQEAFKLVEFGTRRRFLDVNYQIQCFDMLVNQIPNSITTSSNVYVAYTHGLVPSGTMAHEFLQAMQGFVGIRDSQKYGFEMWQKEYGKNKLGIALSDVLGMNPFFVAFNKELTESYKGMRQDSGCPKEWGDKVIKHYNHFNVDPMDKDSIFSDGLDIPKSFDLLNYFYNRLAPVFGIGTNLTNDVGIKPLQIVLKMTWCNGQSVAKLSDDPAKSMCKDIDYMHKVGEVSKEMNIEYETLYSLELEHEEI
jgi:nicotinate phosphoribosyltransferase